VQGNTLLRRCKSDLRVGGDASLGTRPLPNRQRRAQLDWVVST
jgi:hypothetical protein